MDYQELKLLEDDLWEAADQLRANSKLTASEYSMPVLGLVFLRHATTRFNALLPEVEKAAPARATGALRENRIKLGFQGEAAIDLPETARYDYLAALPAGTNVGRAIRDAQELMATVEPRLQEMGDLRDRASVQPQMKAAIIDRLLKGMTDDFSSDDIEARAEIIVQSCSWTISHPIQTPRGYQGCAMTATRPSL